MSTIINREWTFTNTEIGPKNWKNKYETCNTSYQSPINIITKNVVQCNLECRIEFHYFAGPCKVRLLTNQYKTDEDTRSNIVYLEYQNGSYVNYNDNVFVLKKVYFFPGGLHTVDNGKYDMEIVLSHIDDDENVLNISTFVSRSDNFGESQNFFSQWSPQLINIYDESKLMNEKYMDKIMNDLPIDISVDKEWNINNALPVYRSFFLYLGSDVFPPCNGNVKWIILKEAVDILYVDLEPFIRLGNKYNVKDGKLYSEPMREIQPNPSFVSGRKIERVIYENNNSNNGGIQKDKIYIKCKRIQNEDIDITIKKDEKKDDKNKYTAEDFFNSTYWKIIKNIVYLIIYILAIWGAYKFLKWFYTSGKLRNLQSDISGIPNIIDNLPTNSNKVNNKLLDNDSKLLQTITSTLEKTGNSSNLKPMENQNILESINDKDILNQLLSSSNKLNNNTINVKDKDILNNLLSEVTKIDNQLDINTQSGGSKNNIDNLFDISSKYYKNLKNINHSYK